MEDNLLPLFIMRESGASVNDTPKIHCTDPISNDDCITSSKSELKIPLHINDKFYFFHTRKPTAKELHSCENIFITPDCQHWNPYCTLYEINEKSMLNYEGEITQANRQEHHLVDHDMDDVNIASITDTAYEKHIYNSTYNAYYAHVHNMPSNPDSEIVSAIHERSEISKMMRSIGSITKSDMPCDLFSGTIIGQLEELEGHICDILGPEAVAQVKANNSNAQEICGKAVNKTQLRNIWVVSEELTSKAVHKNSQLWKHHAANSLSWQTTH